MSLDSNGYEVFDPYSIFSRSQIDSINSFLYSNFPKWDLGYDFTLDEIKSQYPLLHFSKSALNERLYYGKKKTHSLTDNSLEGRRATLNERHFSHLLRDILSSNNLHDYLSSISPKRWAFVNGSLSIVYPECQGEPYSYHVDVPGFFTSRRFYKPNSLINILTYLDDVDDSCAPIELVPSSHLNYRYFNSLFQSSLGAFDNEFALGSTYKVVPKEVLQFPSSTKIVGSTGSSICMDGWTLHAPTQNFSSHPRPALILNFSRDDSSLFKSYFLESPLSCISTLCILRGLPFSLPSFTPHISLFFFKKFIKHLMLIPCKSFIHAFKNYFFSFLSRSQKSIRRLFDRIISKQKPYVNLGAGASWYHPLVLGLDCSPRADVFFDFSKNSPLPFKPSSIKGFYTSHCLEHLVYSDVLFVLSEVWRCLTPGGKFRLTVPDIQLLLDAYDNNNLSTYAWLYQIPGVSTDDSWLRLIVRLFAAPVEYLYSDDQLYSLYSKLDRSAFLDHFEKEVSRITDPNLLPPHAHKSWWTNDRWTNILLELGFTDVSVSSYKQSSISVFRGRKFDSTLPQISLYIEASKPFV